MDRGIKCDQDILFRITKKEADFVISLPKQLQVEFEKYQILNHKFKQMTKNGLKCHNKLPDNNKLEK